MVYVFCVDSECIVCSVFFDLIIIMFFVFDKLIYGGFSIGIELLFDNDWFVIGDVKCLCDGCCYGVFDIEYYVIFVKFVDLFGFCVLWVCDVLVYDFVFGDVV